MACLLARGAAVVSGIVHKARPVLGIVCCTRQVGTEPAQAVINRYAEAAMRYADAAALLVPALPALMRADEVVGRLDGILLTGSPSNVEPARYGHDGAADAEGPYDAARDAMTAALVEAMLQLQRPVFGVCRGFQELNVAFGGTLRRDLGRTALPHHSPDGVAFDAMFDHRHPVQLAGDGMLAAAFHRDVLTVNSVHYQGIDRLGDGLKVEARAPDGIVEAVSSSNRGAPVLAVQWHPEWQTDANPDSQTFFRLLGRALRGEPLPEGRR